MTMLRVARLMLLCRVLIKGPEALVSLIVSMSSVSRGWTSVVISDLKWLTLSEDFVECSSFSFSEWVDAIKNQPKVFKKRLVKFSRTRLANIVEDASGKPSGSPDLSASSETMKCDLCDKTFGTLQQLQLHRFKAHGALSVWRLFIGHHTHCPICLKLFWSRERVLNHIKYRSKVCKSNLLIRGHVCDETTACEIDALVAAEHVQLQRKGFKRSKATEPVLRLHGPLLPIILPEEVKASKHHPLGHGHNYH
jgi:hypothetical protein